MIPPTSPADPAPAVATLRRRLRPATSGEPVIGFGISARSGALVPVVLRGGRAVALHPAPEER